MRASQAPSPDEPRIDRRLEPKLRPGSVTILTVYHNRVGGVVESIQSLLAQDYPDKQIIVVDDQSTDGTAELIDSTFSGHPELRIVHNAENKGFTRTLIDELSMIDTEFVAIHGSGDISLPGRISTQVRVLREHEDVGVVSGVSAKPRQAGLKFYTTRDLMKENRVKHGSACFRTTAYRNVGGYRAFFTSRQDKDLWLRMSLKWRICTTAEPIYQFVNQPDSVSHRDPTKIIPSLLSNYSVDQIKKRLARGVDDLDMYGAHGALLYDPSAASKVFLRSAYFRLRARNFDLASSYIRSLTIISPHSPWAVISKILFLPVLGVADAVHARLRPVIRDGHIAIVGDRE